MAAPQQAMLEGESPVETFILKRRRWRAVGTTVSTHLHPTSITIKSGSITIESGSITIREAAAGLHEHLLNIAHFIGHLLKMARSIVLYGAQRRNISRKWHLHNRTARGRQRQEPETLHSHGRVRPKHPIRQGSRGSGRGGRDGRSP